MDCKKIIIDAGKQIPNTPEVRLLFKLMMFVDSSRAATRWIDSPKGESPEDNADRIIAVVTGAGWAAEAICEIKKNKHIISPKVFEADKEIAEMWDEEIEKSNPSSTMKILYRIRDKCFAHRDDKYIRKSIDRMNKMLDKGESIDAVSTNTNGAFRGTRYPLVSQIYSHELFDFPFDPDKSRETIREVGRYLGRINRLLSMIIQKLILSTSIPFKHEAHGGDGPGVGT